MKDTVQQSAAEETNWKDEQFGSVVGAVLTVSTVVGPLYYMNLARKEGKLAKGTLQLMILSPYLAEPLTL